jgi:copper transport protein
MAKSVADARRASRRATRAVAVVLFVGLALPLTAAPAAGHAAFVSSEPEPGAELSSTPGVVLLRFTEPLIPRLSRATVTDPDGRTFEGQVAREREVRVPLATNAPGIYEVAWTTVSPVDGHTLRGSFRFGVGVSPGEGAEGGTGAEPQRADLVIAVGRAVEYSALLLALGMLLVGRLARRDPPLPWVRPRLVPVLAVALASGTAVVLGEALLATGSASPGGIAAYFTAGLSGVARVARIGLEGLGLVAAIRGRAVVPAVGGALVALAAAGHAAAVSPKWWGVGVDAFHLVAAGLWAGGIMALAILRPPGGWRGPEGQALLDRFSPVALSAFVLTVGFGVLRGIQELSGLGDLVGTAYGRVLALKVVGVLTMVPLSVFLWLRLRGTPRAEAAIAVGVVAAAAVLAAYPLPPARLAEAEAASERPAGSSALPRPGDITMGGEAGEVLVGLAIRPAEPGPNEVLVYVLPLEGEEAASGLPVRVSVGGSTVRMDECGLACRRVELDLRGGERLEVTVGGEDGGTDVLEVPRLPAPDGSALYRRMQQRMHGLRTYRLEEVLSSGRASVRASYAFQAPDRMRVEVDSGSQRVIVGDREWRREKLGQPWQEEQAIPPEIPQFVWDFGRDAITPRIVGTERIGGTFTTALSFFARSGSAPIWFRLWVEEEGLVRRAEMRAQGHFMDHRYFAFDAPFEVEPPA